MLKKTIKYVDFDGEERVEDFYFNLSKAELVEMELSHQGGLTVYIQRIIQEQDGPTLVRLFKELVLKSYGKKSDDGKRFIKSDQLREEFTQTNAYSELFTLLATDAEAAAEFVRGIAPSDGLEPQTQPKTPQDRKPKGLPTPQDIAEFEAWKASQKS